MPDFRIRDPRTGRTITLTGDSPPSALELEQIFASGQTRQARAAISSWRISRRLASLEKAW